MEVDFIIVGQGLAGSALAIECLRRGKRIVVFDEPARNKASAVAAGIFNPVTGKVMTKTFLADRLFPFLNKWYAETEKNLHSKFFRSLPVYRPFLSHEEQQQWLRRSGDDALKPFVQQVCEEPYLPAYLNNPHGGLIIRQSGVLDVARWVSSVRDLLRAGGMYREEHVDDNEVVHGEDIEVRDIRASKVVYCNGLAARGGRWFGWLPLRALKGEILTIRAEFSDELIFSRGVYLVPTGMKGSFLAGSTYQHEPFSEGTSEVGRTQLDEGLTSWLRSPYQVIHHEWGIRPTVIDRRPLLGSHPQDGNVIIFNGLGTKGVSLAPWFATVLIDWVDNGAALPDEVNISRFKSLYSN